MSDVNVKESKEIEKIIIINDDGSEEVIEKGMISSLKLSDDSNVELNLRFVNLTLEEINKIIYGINLMSKGE